MGDIGIMENRMETTLLGLGFDSVKALTAFW